MKRILLLLTLIPVLALADAVIFSGNDVKALKPNLDLFGAAKILTTSSDPSTGGGLSAPIGSIALNVVTGETYSKTGAGNTAWVKKQNYPVDLTTDVTGILPVANGGTGSATQNFVDLTSDQTVGGNKTFSNTIVGSISGNAATVTTNANLSGDITSVGNTTSYNGTVPISKGGTGSTSQNFVDLTTAQNVAGVKTFSDTIQGNISGNASTVTTNANLTGPITSVGNTTSVASQTGTGSKFVMDTSPTISAPTISGHPTIEGVTATGATGTGKIVYDTSPTLVTPNIGAATGSSLTTSGNISASGTVSGNNLSGTNTGDLLSRSDKDVADVTTTKLTAPYGQLSTSAAGIRNIDTGNENILSNSAFRVGGGSSSSVPNWTLNTADADDDGTYLTITPTSAGGGLKQSVTTNAAYMMGGQGAVVANVKTNGTDVYVCPLTNGSRPSDISKYCGKVPATTTAVPFPRVIVPFIMDGTSNGIEIYSTGTSPFQFRKTVPVFAGQSAPFQGVNGTKLVGTLSYAPTINCIWQTSSATFANFAADTDCSTPTVTGNIKAPSTKIPAIVLPTGSQSGTYLITAKAMFYKGTAGYASYRFSDGTNYVNAGSSSYADNTATGIISGQITYSTSINSDTTIQIQGKTGTGTLSIYSNDTTDGLYIEVYYFPPESKIYSQASQDVAYQPCTFSTLAWQGLGTVTNNLLCARKGQNLLMKGGVTLGTVAASQAQIPLPINFGTITTASNIPSTSYASGFVLREAFSANTIYSLIQLPSVSYLAMAGQLGNTTINPNSPLNGSAMFSNGDILSIPEIAIPIQGWQDYGVIVGSFAGIEKCSSPYECTDTFSAKVDGLGNVSGENLEWINGGCTYSAGVCALTFQTYLKDGTNPLIGAMNCAATMDGTATATILRISSNTTSGITLNNIDRTGTSQNAPFEIKCQKGTNDYKPKTAKVASSIGVPTVPGITTTGTGNSIDTFSFSFGTTNATTACSASPCSYLDQIGDVVSSVTRVSSGSYTANFTKTYAKLKCVGGAGSISHMPALSCSNCNTLSMLTSNASNSAVADSFGTVLCTGTY